MAKGTTCITLVHPSVDVVFRTDDKAQAVAAVVAAVEGHASGFNRYFGHSLTVAQHTASATGTLTLSGASGAVGGTINGVTVTATASGGDTNSAALVAAAINASGNALVNQHVTASANGAVVTLTAKTSGPAGNAVTLVASGTGVTASGARLAGGVQSSSGSF